MKSSRSHVGRWLLCAGALACQGQGTPAGFTALDGNLATSSVLLTTDREQYRSGELIVLTIENQGNEPLAYNACTRELEIREGSAWVAGPVSLRLCSREVWYAAPGQSRKDSTDLDLGLAPGEYRLIIGFTGDAGVEGSSIRAASNPFRIEP